MAQDHINALYREYLGRDAEDWELQNYASFGPTIEPSEREAFIQGAVASGDRGQNWANSKIREMYSYINDLYRTYLGRDAELDELRAYASEFGSTIEPNEVEAFIRGGDRELSQDQIADLIANFRNAGADASGGGGDASGGGGDASGGGGDASGGGGEGVDRAQYAHINALYQQYLGRDASPQELQFYFDKFGPTIEQQEEIDFIRGGNRELSQDQIDDFIAALGGGDGGGAGGVGDGTTTNYRSQIIDLYKTQLGRIPSETEIQNWLNNLNDEYTFKDLKRDFTVGAQREIGYKQRQEFVKNIPEFQQTVVPEFEFPTEPRPAPVLGLTGLPTTPQNIQTLYQSYLGRPAGLQEIATQQEIMGPVISPQKASDFAAAASQELAGTGDTYRPFTGVGYAQPVPTEAVEARAGGVINYAEGGEAALAEPTSPRLTAQDLGSKFDVSKFIDEEGRLVGGYSRPIRDEYGVIIGYDFQPYERDVVFGENLRGREAAARSAMTEEERQMALVDMLARQGRTGIDPMAAGIAAIPYEARRLQELGVPLSSAVRNRPRYYAKGGLADVAQDLASKGRFGDTMLAHINPQEAGLLKALGGSGTINPETGLPEFAKIFGIDLFPKKGIKLNLGPLGNIKFGKKSSDLIQAAAALYAGSYLPGGLEANLGKTALTYGGVRAAATGNLMEGIQAGLTAYGMGNLYTSFGPGATTPVPAPTDGAGGTAPVGTAAGGGAAESAMVGSQNVPLETESFMQGDPGISTTPMRTVAQPVYGTSGIPGLDKTVGATSASQGYLRGVLPPGVQEYTPDFLLDASGKTLLVGAGITGTAAGMQADKARAAQLRALAAAQEEERRKRFAPQIASLPPLYSSGIRARAGGLMKLAGGGMTYMEAGGTTGSTGEPRDVTGTGDGMSDSVPASIEGVQEARLADGEFVIPADVVADIGNGSSDAGSKKLYDMMDRIRQARHGTTEQPPEIKAERLMPA